MPVVKKRESYRWTVEHVVAKRSGKAEVFAFDVEFKALSQSKVNELAIRAAKLQLPVDDFIAETFAGWHDMTKEGAVEPWAYSPEAVKELIELYPGLPSSLIAAWTESVTGAARKN